MLAVALSEQDTETLRRLMADKNTSKTQIVRQAIRLYALIDKRLSAGERMLFVDNDQKTVEFIGLSL